MSAYQDFAQAYDGLMTDVGYQRRCTYIQRLLKGIKGRTLVDLGCGTGTLDYLLSDAGWDVTGLDASAEMLSQAWEKGMNLPEGAPRPRFVHQSMEKLRLPHKVDAVISTIDAINYVTRPAAVEETFRRVHRYLCDGGRFVFDVNTPYKLSAMDGGLYVDETPESYCVWRTRFSLKTQICTYDVDLFLLCDDGAWERTQESHRERAYTQQELMAWLKQAGFSNVSVYGDLTTKAPSAQEMRWVFVADKC